MVDTRIRKNEHCVIGLPACDYVFSSTRSCFIAYGFSTSALEVDVLRSVLIERGIEPIEAGERIEPGKFTFCTKICSKIITSQFCIVLANDEPGGANANVSIEYGLMLGHNKYVIPFQRSEDKLPFNVAGLDTIKYTQSNFKRLSVKAIDQAIEETIQTVPLQGIDQELVLFATINNVMFANIQRDQGERALFDLGNVLNFKLLVNFDGLKYIFLGDFSGLKSHPIIWRVNKLLELHEARAKGIDQRVSLGLADEKQATAARIFWDHLEAWIVVSSDLEKREIVEWLENNKVTFPIKIFTRPEISRITSELPGSTIKHP